MRKYAKKLHLWLALPFGVILTLVCFSGAVLAFEKEFTQWAYAGLYQLETVGKDRLPVGDIAAKVASSLPDDVRVTGITIYSDPARTYQVNLSKPHHASVFVNPYTGEVKGVLQAHPILPHHVQDSPMAAGKPSCRRRRLLGKGCRGDECALLCLCHRFGHRNVVATFEESVAQQSEGQLLTRAPPLLSQLSCGCRGVHLSAAALHGSHRTHMVVRLVSQRFLCCVRGWRTARRSQTFTFGRTA